MSHTLAKNTIREILADTLRDHRGDAPGDQADALLETLRTYAPRSFVDERLDLSGKTSRFEDIAKEMILAHSFDVAQYEIHAAYPRLSNAEVQVIDDLIGQATVTVVFD